MTAAPKLSVVIPVTEHFDDVEDTYRAYREAVEKTGMPFEFIYVLDGDYPEVKKTLLALKGAGEKITIIVMAKWFGEATALNIGFQNAAGSTILTLPAYLQIEPGEIPRLLECLENFDMVTARRWPRRDSRLNQLQTKLFHLPLQLISGRKFSDLGCSARAMKAAVLDELTFYGDQHRFLPLLAFSQGFKVRELPVSV